jgi:peptidoglycan/xylan/chitin deacetylase (PgdA/CDA1 family)
MVKVTVAGLGYYGGGLRALGWLADRLHGASCAILTYHRVLRGAEVTAEPDPGLVTTVETFTAHMRFIAQRYRPLALDEAVARLARGALPPRACAITFDDGWRDSYTNAYPILRELNIPATIFVATSYVGTERPLWTRQAARVIDEALRRGRYRLVSDALAGAGLQPPPARTYTPRATESLVSALKRMPATKRERIVADLAAALGCPAIKDPWLTWDELREMHEGGVLVGSHTRTHAILTAEAPERVLDELVGSRADIQRHLGITAIAFCYPDGATDERAEAMVREAGYSLACSTQPGVARANADLLHLPRIAADERMAHGINSGFSRALFVCQAAGGFRGLAQMANRRLRAPGGRGARGRRKCDDSSGGLAATERHP